jgi:hypothetical protein
MRCVLAALSIALISSTSIAAVGEPFSFYGTWKVDSIVGYSEVSVGEEQLRGLIGRQVVISKNGVKVGGDDCKADSMKAATQATTPILLQEYKAGRKDAGLPARTLVLNADPCGYIFRSGDSIVFSQDGGFFRASRVKQ